MDISLQSAPQRLPLRIWPALILLVLLGIAKFGLLAFEDMNIELFFMLSFMGPMVIAGLAVLYWVFLSRATLVERIIGFLALGNIGMVGYLSADPSLDKTFFPFLVLPWGAATFLIAVVLFSRITSPHRLTLILAATALTFGYWDLLRNDGTTGTFNPQLSWRWHPTKEENFLASMGKPKPSSTGLGITTWSGFRGPQRDAVVPGIVLESNWDAHPPIQVWKRPVGPSWASFAMAGQRLFTQEQRGDFEVVVCLDADTGNDIWVQKTKTRFEEKVAGPGPRATPTLFEDKLYNLGSTGYLHCLDPLTGTVIWHRNIADDAENKPPMWGFASSPLVLDDLVIVHAGGKEDKGIFAYDKKTGEPRWHSASGDHSYSSPHFAKVAGQDSILMMTNKGLTAYDPATGKELWDYKWDLEFYRVVQPLVVAENEVLLATGLKGGTKRIEVKKEGDAFVVTEKWTSEALKPPFNDYVSHKGFLYGFDTKFFTCIDLATGQRQWKGGRYGAGQVLLLPDADQMLVLAEETGLLVLLKTNPKKLEELARHQVLDGKTWNHPILVGNRIYVRNAQEAACFELPVVSGK